MEAVQAHEATVAATPIHSPTRAAWLGNLGRSLESLYRAGGNPTHLDRAIENSSAACDLTPSGSPDRAMLLHNLGQMLSMRYRLGGDQDDLTGAAEAFRQSCRAGLEGGGVEWAFKSARTWGEWAARRVSWREAAEAYGYAIEAMEAGFRVQVVREDKELWLEDAQGFPALAAYAQGQAGDSEAAVMALERGRALLLSEMLERTRANLDNLTATGHGDLVDRFRTAVAAVRVLDEDAGRLDVATQNDRGAKALAKAKAAVDDIIEQIRHVQGYENFLAPPSFDVVVEAARNGTLAYIAATEFGGIALIVAVNDTPVNVVWLPGLRRETLAAKVETFRRAYIDRRRDLQAWRTSLDDVTGWLWTALMGPLIDALPDRGQATLIPTGLLGLLPLHAAWAPAPSEPTGRRYALERIQCSYAPNARSLAAARALTAVYPGDDLLAVDEPRPVTADQLPGAQEEIDAALSCFDRSRHTRLAHEAATLAAVQAALPRHDVIHLACHGKADVTEPLASALLMAGDEPLTLRQLLNDRIASRLVVLSACETAIPGTNLPDEVVNLPTALLQAGAAGVIGSLWSVPDGPSTMMLMGRFYELWRGEELEISDALTRAQAWVRDSTNAEKLAAFPSLSALREKVPVAARSLWDSAQPYRHPYYWAAFIHVGA
jgi:CHAT domain-containing protein